MFENKTIKYKSDNPDTRDIIHALCAVVPVAVKQIRINDFYHLFTGDIIQDGKNVCQWIQNNIQYKADGYDRQDIQLPNRLIYGTRLGDCKSFSLLFLSICSKYGYKGGFRFASYNVNKKPTHVYNFLIDGKGNKFIFDSCVKNYQESKNYTFIEDMEINYLNGIPVMLGADNDYIGKRGEKIKKIALALPRQAFLGLVALNFRGLATRISEVKDNVKVKNFWLKLGGDPNKLISTAEKNKNKKALFGKGKNKIGSPYEVEYNFEDIGPTGVEEVTALIATAAPIIIAVSNLLKQLGKPISTEGLPETEPLGNFVPTDAETQEGRNIANTTAKDTGLKIKPLYIGIGAAALIGLYFLTKKKK